MPDDAPPSSPAPLPPRIVLYDGVCGLCHLAVAFLLRHDRRRRLWFAPLQGETAARLRHLHPAIPAGLESVVLVEEGRVWLRSRALVGAARQLGWPWRGVAWLGLLPQALLDAAYRGVARIRYRLFGRFPSCRAPRGADRQRLLP